MLFNGGVQISGTSFKRFVGILPKVRFFLLFRAVVSLSISLTSVLDRAPSETLGVPGPKMFWMPWRMTQKRIYKKRSLAKYDFRKSEGGGGGVHGRRGAY